MIQFSLHQERREAGHKIAAIEATEITRDHIQIKLAPLTKIPGVYLALSADSLSAVMSR